MKDFFNKTVEACQQKGQERFSSWDAEFFGEQVRSCSWALCRMEGEGARAIVRSFLELLTEAIGTGMISPDRVSSFWQAPLDFAPRLFLHIVPRGLANVSPDKRADALARVWNLCEGIHREPLWFRRYLVMSLDSDTTLEDLPELLELLLEPVLAEPPPSAWRGPFRVTCLDLSDTEEDFFPGDLYLAAPSVLCVRDRREPEEQVAVFLQKEGGSFVLGETYEMDALEEASDAFPSLSFAPDEVKVGDFKVPLPWVRFPHCHLMTRQGFVAITVRDSQCLWIVENP